MSNYTISITPTEAQSSILESLHNPHVAAAGDGAISVIEIHDDQDVVVYVIAPDGTYTYERLLDGFHYGWTRFNSEGLEIDADDNRVEDGIRDGQ